MTAGLTAVPAIARPDMRPLGKNIADTGSAWYRFQSKKFVSQDGERHYRVWLAIPKSDAPPGGYPVLWLLDGNAAMAHLTEPLLKKLSSGTPPVLVAVGYDTHLPFDVVARNYDYTPPNDAPDTLVTQPHGRKGGGSHQFRQLLLNTIVPWAERLAPSNPQRRALWGALLRRTVRAGYLLSCRLVQPLFCGRSLAELESSAHSYPGPTRRRRTA
ncbi:hypothetical protein LD112_23945 [Pantoea agglomerans]|nr:hypothetical protein [Pantoea agglomerans]